MIHCVLHDPEDSVAVVVVEGVAAGATLTGLVLDEDRTITLACDMMFRTANGRLTAAEALGHREFVLTRLYESA